MQGSLGCIKTPETIPCQNVSSRRIKQARLYVYVAAIKSWCLTVDRIFEALKNIIGSALKNIIFLKGSLSLATNWMDFCGRGLSSFVFGYEVWNEMKNS